MRDTFDMIADFADVEAIDYAIFRDESEPTAHGLDKGKRTFEADRNVSVKWVVQFKFRDAYGPYSVYHDLVDGTDESKLRKRLLKKFQDARMARAEKRLMAA